MNSKSTLETIQNSIDTNKKRLDSLRPLSQEQSQNLKQVYDIDMTYHSNAIEGNTLSYSETKLVLENGITISGKSMNEHLEVINHKDAIDFVESLVKHTIITESDSNATWLHTCYYKSRK
jgi:Fic family protein